MKSETNTNGLGPSGVLQLIFVVLKITGLIDWPWPVVLIPLWIDLGIIGILIIIAGVYWLVER